MPSKLATSATCAQLTFESAFSGFRLTDTALEIPESMSDDDVFARAAAIGTQVRATPWRVGDYALEFRKRHEAREQQRKADAKASGGWYAGGASFDAVLATAWGVSAGGVRRATEVARFYPPHLRRASLTYRHHVDAMRAVGWVDGNLGGALEILGRAEKEGWGCSDLRAHICPPPAASAALLPFENAYEELDEADKWATHNWGRIESIDADRAAALLNRLRKLAEVIDLIRNRAAVAAH